MSRLSDMYIGDSIIEIYETENKVTVDKREVIGEFWYPRGGTVAGDRIYITDSYHHCVKVFSLDGEAVGRFGEEVLREPHGIAALGEAILVCDKDNGYIRKFDLNGNLILTFPIKMRLPTVIAVGGEKIYCADTNGNSVYIFDMNGELTGKITSNLKYPAGIAIGGEYIYVSSQFDKKIQRYSKEGIFAGTYKEGEYFSFIKISNGEICYYDEKNMKLYKERVIEERRDAEELLMKYCTKSETGYYLIKRDINRAVELFRDKSIWRKEREEENHIIAPYLQSTEFYEFMEKYSGDKGRYFEKVGKEEYFIQLEKSINKVSDDKLEKPKAIFMAGDEIYVSLFNKKILARISESAEIKGYYVSEIQIDKVAVLEGKVYFIDYFYKRFYSLDMVTEESAVFSEGILESPLDLRVIDGKLWVLDSVLKEIIIFSSNGTIDKRIKIEGIEPVSFDKRDKLYILDKRSGEIYKYNNSFELECKIPNKEGLKYPEGIALDEEENIYITDEGNNRIVKYNTNGEFIFELGGFAMPKDIFYNNGKIFISDYANDSIKIYKVR